jgi:hypothetical protein
MYQSAGYFLKLCARRDSNIIIYLYLPELKITDYQLFIFFLYVL